MSTYMPKFRVTIDRTERIEFELEATDRFDAEERYMSDGDETGSQTIHIEVVGVQNVDKLRGV